MMQFCAEGNVYLIRHWSEYKFTVLLPCKNVLKSLSEAYMMLHLFELDKLSRCLPMLVQYSLFLLLSFSCGSTGKHCPWKHKEGIQY